jgi:hypothetical protein
MKSTYTALVPTPNRRSINSGLSAAKVSTLKELFGPFPDLPTDCGKNRNAKISAMLEVRNVGPFRVTGIKPALDSLERIFAGVKRDHPDLYKIVGTAGMHCYRRVRGGYSPSNHCAGTAIDITVNGVLPEMDTTPETPELIPNGFLILYGYFYREGWLWAAGYAGRVDAMHWEVADQTLRKWAENGWRSIAPEAPQVPMRLLVNGTIIDGAELKNGHWYCREEVLAPVLGSVMDNTFSVGRTTPVMELVGRWGWHLEKYTPNPAQNRADLRVVRA